MDAPIPKPPDAYRVLHTADWHLGKMLGEHPRDREHAAFLSFLLDTIRHHAVDALVVAGDIFDSANPPQSAVAQYYNFLSALFRQGGCTVIIVGGNHDSPAHLDAPRQLLQALGAHVLGALPGAISETLIPLPNAKAPRLLVAAIPFLRDRDLRTGLPGQSSAEIQQALVDGIRQRYATAAEAAKPWKDRGVPLMGTGHLTVLGARTSDSERDIHVGGLGAIDVGSFPGDFDYIALGHLHRPQGVGGRATIRYAGSPIPLSFSEASDAKSVMLLDFSGGVLSRQTELRMPPVRPLVRLTARRATVAETLTKFTPPPSELPAWVEVTVEDPVAGENLYETVQQWVKGRNFEVLRVAGIRTESGAGSGSAPEVDAADIADLLAAPAAVFQRRLARESNLTDPEREALTLAFRELVELREAGGAAAGVDRRGRGMEGGRP